MIKKKWHQDFAVIFFKRKINSRPPLVVRQWTDRDFDLSKMSRSLPTSVASSSYCRSSECVRKNCHMRYTRDLSAISRRNFWHTPNVLDAATAIAVPHVRHTHDPRLNGLKYHNMVWFAWELLWYREWEVLVPTTR